MPLYDYRCEKCGHFRAMRRMTECGAPAPCPECGTPANRILSAPFVGGRDSGGGAEAAGGCTPQMRHMCGQGCVH